MKIRLMSDLHLCVNNERYKAFRLADVDTFTLIAGDISADVNQTVRWINDNVKNGLFIEGNHICYNHRPHSIQYFHRELSNYYTMDANVSFLQDNYKIVDDVVFVGGTLWTDMRLTADKDEKNMDYFYWKATRGLNDYQYGMVNFGDLDSENGIDAPNKYRAQLKCKDLVGLEPIHTVQMFEKTLSVIDEVCKQFPDKKIVVLTHHAPSFKSIDEAYVNSEVNHCYASNLEDFILDRPNIKAWCHGHVHCHKDYMIGNCRVMCNPRGYERYHENNEFNTDFVFEV